MVPWNGGHEMLLLAKLIGASVGNLGKSYLRCTQILEESFTRLDF